MNVRGGNGYVEDWPNARLLRDAYLGSIWEGATNVVALDVQRAIVRERCHEPLLDWVRRMLDAVGEPEAKPSRDDVLVAADRVSAQIASWDGLDADAVQLEAREVADGLYHVLAAALLLSMGGPAAGAPYTKLRLAGLPPSGEDLARLDVSTGGIVTESH
jgi:acyl-CoA dehydrogenase